MIRAASQEDAAVAAILDVLGLGQAQQVGIEVFRCIEVGDEQMDRPDLGHLERPLQHDAADTIVVRELLHGTKAAAELDAAALAVHDFRHLSRLRKCKSVPHRTQIGRGGLAPAVPADLLHAVIELDAVSVRIEHVKRPIAAGKIAAEPADGDLALGEIRVRIGDFLKRADLE